MTDGLDRCPTPWCGPKHEKYTWQGPDDLFCVICDGCQVEGPHCKNEGDAQDAWNTRTTSLAAQDQQVLALVEAARDAGDVLQSAASPSNLDPQYSDQIAALGERIGYGALMHGASALWRKSLGDLAGSEFAAGPCVSTAASRLARLDDALMPFRGETLPDAPSLAAQDLVDCETCCGNGEVVTDWERYKHPHDGDVGDEAVADCPDCDGNGKIEVPSLAAQDGLVEALERCAQIVEQWNHRQNEKVDDIKYIVRNALSAIKGDKS